MGALKFCKSVLLDSFLFLFSDSETRKINWFIVYQNDNNI